MAPDASPEPDTYPESWTPPHIKRAEQALAISIDSFVAALSDAEFADLVARTRPEEAR